MKKMCALLVAFVICALATTAFAAGTTDAKITLTPDKNSVAIGETVTIVVGLTGDTNGYGINGTAKIAPKWDMEYFEYVSSEVDSTTFSLTNSTNVGTAGLTSGYVAFSQKVVTDDGVVSGDQVFGSVTLKALKATTTTTAISLHASSTQVNILAGSSVADRAGVAEDTTVAITITGGEEEFEPTYEGVKAEDGSVTEGFASGSKVATVFAKATGDLAAGTYGIVFGGQTYVGAAPVAAGKYWVIRLYDPSGEILTGTYDCQKFVGEAVEAVDYKLETK